MTMDCDVTYWSDHKTFLEGFVRRLQSHRIPVTGSIEITYRCNLSCSHCYVGRRSSWQGGGTRELNTDEWRCLIDEMVAAGCLFLLITGGEPLLWPHLFHHNILRTS